MNKNSFGVSMPLNGVFIIECLFICYMMIPIKWKESILQADGKDVLYAIFGILGLIVLVSFCVKINKYVNIAYRITTTFIFFYYSVYLIYSVFYISLDLPQLFQNILIRNWLMVTLIAILFEVYLVLQLKKDFALYAAINIVLRRSFDLLLILFFCFCVAFDIHEILPFKLTYLVGATVALIVVIAILGYAHKKKVKLNEFINITQINILMSFVFYGFVLLICALLGTIYLKKFFSTISDWVPILIISLALTVVGITYHKEIKQLLKNEVWLIFYFLAWAIIPIFLFIFFLQRSFLGTFSTFQILLAIMLCIDATVLLAFGSDMENIFDKLNDNKNLTIASNSKVLTSSIKLILANITAIVILFKSIFDKEDALDNFIIFISNTFKNFNDITHIFPANLDVDCNFKIIIFMFISIVVIFLMSWLSFEFEKKIYILVNFTRKPFK